MARLAERACGFVENAMMSRWSIAIAALLAGVVGGGAGAYYWLGRFGPAHVQPEAEARPAHEGHEEHEGDREHAGHGDGEGLELSEEAVREYGIEIAEARGGTVETVLTLPGEIVLNADRVAHIVPRVSG